MAQGQYIDAQNGGEAFHDLGKSLKDPQGMPFLPPIPYGVLSRLPFF